MLNSITACNVHRAMQHYIALSSSPVQPRAERASMPGSGGISTRIARSSKTLLSSCSIAILNMRHVLSQHEMTHTKSAKLALQRQLVLCPRKCSHNAELASFSGVLTAYRPTQIRLMLYTFIHMHNCSQIQCDIYTTCFDVPVFAISYKLSCTLVHGRYGFHTDCHEMKVTPFTSHALPKAWTC